MASPQVVVSINETEWMKGEQLRIQELNNLGWSRMQYYVPVTANDLNSTDRIQVLKKIIFKTFKPLNKWRKTLDKGVDSLKSSSRTRGYLSLAALLASLISVFIPFSNANRPDPNTGNGAELLRNAALIFDALALLLSGFVVFGISHLLKEHKTLEDEHYKLLCTASFEVSEFESTDAPTSSIGWTVDHLFKINLRQISSKLDFGGCGYRFVYLEIGVVVAFIIAVSWVAVYYHL